MTEDFLPANEGFDRRFPIRATLGNYKPATLYKVFIEALARNFVGPRPSIEARRQQWDNQLQAKIAECYGWFTNSAVLMLQDVITASQQNQVHMPAELVYDDLNKLLKAQAGAMVNLAGIAALMFISNDKFKRLGNQVGDEPALIADRAAMFDILLTAIQQRFPGKDKSTGKFEYFRARGELCRALCQQKMKWMVTDESGNYKWATSRLTAGMTVPVADSALARVSADALNLLHDPTIGGRRPRPAGPPRENMRSGGPTAEPEPPRRADAPTRTATTTWRGDPRAARAVRRVKT